jgi:hypothetical protein
MKSLYTTLCILFYFPPQAHGSSIAAESGPLLTKTLNTTAIGQRMSSHVLQQRLRRLPPETLPSTRNHDIWKPRLHMNDLYAAVPSNKTKAFKDFHLIVNYSALRKTQRQEYGVHFDICLARSPHQFLLEGLLTTGDFRFEDGLNVRDIYGGIDVQYALVNNEVFPNDIIQHLLKGKSLDGTLNKEDLPPALMWLEAFMLDTTTISDETVYNFSWMPVL